MGFGSFSSNDENTSFEQGLPLNQAAKNVTKAAVTQTKTHADDTTKKIVEQLYGVSSTTDATGQHSNDAAAQGDQSAHTDQASQVQDSQNQSEQSQLNETRKKLQELQHYHRQNYYDKYLGEDAQKKHRQEEEQKKQQVEQAEEEEKRRIEAEKAQMDDGSLLPAGKKTGAMFGKKQQKPIALTQAKTKTEINRGTSG